MNVSFLPKSFASSPSHFCCFGDRASLCSLAIGPWILGCLGTSHHAWLLPVIYLYWKLLYQFLFVLPHSLYGYFHLCNISLSILLLVFMTFAIVFFFFLLLVFEGR